MIVKLIGMCADKINKKTNGKLTITTVYNDINHALILLSIDDNFVINVPRNYVKNFFRSIKTQLFY